MRRRHPLRVFSLVCLYAAIAVAACACSENPVGRKCYIGTATTNTAGQSIVASPAYDCQSHTCLHVPLTRELPSGSEYSNLCTAECTSDDSCDRVPESPCQTGFTCAIAVVTGKFCCRTMCICKDYLVIPDGGVLPSPKACEANNPDNVCCNLPGRDDYANCSGR